MLEKFDVVDFLKKQYHDNRLGHAFLLETDDVEKSLKKVISFLKILNCENEYNDNCSKCNLCHLIETEQLPNLVIVRPDGTFIRKEQIIDLKNSLKTKPIFAKYNMYVIINAENLNSSSANTMLKFLEEPDDKIIGFFITNNKENVIDTIKSRCQILLDYYFEEKVDNNLLSEAIDYIKQLECANIETLFYNKDVLIPKISDKEWLITLFKKMIFIYECLYEKKLNSELVFKDIEELNFLLKKDLDYFIKRLNLLKKLLSSLDFNVNNQMVLDRLVLESR